MDRQSQNYPQHPSRPPLHHSATLPSSYHSASPAKHEPVASIAPQGARERRRSERRNTTQSTKRYIPHNGATCGNNLCDSPEISKDEELCPGPEGLELCYRCYKRFKIARRRAREAQRDMTEDWRRPKQRRQISQTTPETTPLESPQRPVTAMLKTPDTEHSDLNFPSPVLKTDSRRKANTYGDEPPPYETLQKEPREQPSPRIARLSDPEKSPGLHSVSTSSLKEYDRHTSRSPRKQRSARGRNRQRHSRNEHARDSSTYEEAEFYKYGRAEENGYYDRREEDNNRRCGCCSMWNRRRKCVVVGLITLSLIVLVIIIAVAATMSRKRGFNYVPSIAQVNNTAAFSSGGATRKNVNNTDDGIGAGTDTYTYYHGDASKFPNQTQWVSFADMWTANLDTFKYSCGWLKRGDDNTPEMIQDIYNAIQDRANASLVDHRIILATIIQETNGCPLVPHTTSSGGTRNPGLMQSHDGHAYDAKHSRLSILQMVQDGTQGTTKGWGLVDNLNTYGNPYKAMRGYNSGYIPDSGDLSEKAGATACYVSDMANRLTGWVRAKTECPDDMH
ncbi:hypothetical protein DPSP01_000164 [Paraphaeosphaeria sporulosa]